MAKTPRAVRPPQDRCDECHALKPSFGFVNVPSEKQGASLYLCPTCYNRNYMRHAGLPELEVSEFQPITRFDAVGKEHTFYFAVHMTTGLGIKASEWLRNGPGGYQFEVLEHPATPVREVYQKLVRKIEAGLAQRYVQSSDFPGIDASQNRLYIKGSAINGRIDESDNGDHIVVVDGRAYSWKEFGAMLSPYTGFNFRIECFDTTDEPEIEADPKRPNSLWWLDIPEPDDKKRGHH